MKPTEGKVVRQHRLFNLNKAQLRELRMKACSFRATLCLIPWPSNKTSVSDGHVYTHDPQRKTDKVALCLERVRPQWVNKKYPSEISGGMQKVGIARPSCSTPLPVLWWTQLRSRSADFLSPSTNSLPISPKTTNITTIINTHDMNSVMELVKHLPYRQGLPPWSGSKDQVLSMKTNTCTILFLHPLPAKVNRWL